VNFLPDFFAHWRDGAWRDVFLDAVFVLGWIEALTAVGVAYARRMIPLRVIAMSNNALGLMLGLGLGSASVLFKHAVNLPMNYRRWREMRDLIEKVRIANETDLNLEWLKPFMHPESRRAGEILFSEGDEGTEAYMLVDGAVKVVEPNVTLHPGAIFGEMALFTDHGLRSATVECETDVRLLVITYEQFEQLYFQNPQFGFYVMRLVVRRFEHNHEVAAARARAAVEGAS